MSLKLVQGQLWKCANGDLLRIVRWERMAIEYKKIENLESGEGSVLQVTKKEFCSLIKGGELLEQK